MVILKVKAGSIPGHKKDKAQLTSDLGIFTEAPLRHKDSDVPMATVPEVLHSNSNAPAGEVVLEAMPAVGWGQHSEAPEESLAAWLECSPFSTCPQGEQYCPSHPPPQDPHPRLVLTPWPRCCHQ